MPRRIYCNILAALFSVLIVMPIVAMLADRQVPMTLTYGGMKPDVVESNTLVSVTWTASKIRKFGEGLFDCEGSVTRKIIDSGGFVIETKAMPAMSYKLIGEQQSGTFSKQFMMPTLLPGIATYQVITTYWCNPVQKYIFPITHIEVPIHFVVGDSKGPKGDTGKQGEKGDQGERGETGQSRE